MKIINNNNPFVILDWEEFKEILNLLPKKYLIKKFSEDTWLVKAPRDYTKGELINKLFIETEEQII